MTVREVCGSSPESVPWAIYSDQAAEELAAKLCAISRCSSYLIDGNTYEPPGQFCELCGAFEVGGLIELCDDCKPQSPCTYI